MQQGPDCREGVVGYALAKHPGEPVNDIMLDKTEGNPMKMTNTMAALLTMFLGSAVWAFAEEDWLSGVDSWGGRKALPAVVNPVMRSPLGGGVAARGVGVCHT